MKHPYVGLSEQEARLRLLDLLQSSPAPINRLLLIVDEAHLLSPKGHEELRTLTDYESGGVPYVSLVLAGQLELEETLAEPAMNALNQRVGCHVSLEPLTIEESYEYIRERLRSAGNDGLTIFSPEALYLICNASEGNPRRLNQLCDHCLLLAYAEGTRPVDAAVVRSALLDLRELPLHWNAPLDLSATLARILWKPSLKPMPPRRNSVPPRKNPVPRVVSRVKLMLRPQLSTRSAEKSTAQRSTSCFRRPSSSYRRSFETIRIRSLRF